MKKELNHILLGCIADDFTGASDAASFLAKNGLKTLLFNGIPRESQDVSGCAAIVIALKTRSIAAADAARDTLEAATWLKNNGAESLYIKYCSTFDSTPKGNIGPDIDAVLEKFGIQYTLLCPSLPVNQRIVRDGVLIVDGKPIAEGHMAHHPLNPIWDSRIAELMRPQGKYECLILNGETMKKPKAEILASVEAFGKTHEHFYVIPDYTTDEEGKKIAEVFGDHALLTGGSGLLEHISNILREKYNCETGEKIPTATNGLGIALSGSCSTMTCKQCTKYSNEKNAIAIYPAKILEGTQTADAVFDEIAKHPEKEYLVFSAGAIDESSRKYKDEETFMKASAALEQFMADIAEKAYKAGYKRIICAGGETSSAICLRLGFDAFIIGESIDPGVPVLTPIRNKDVRMVLKSGNFGKEDFFAKALNMTKGS